MQIFSKIFLVDFQRVAKFRKKYFKKDLENWIFHITFASSNREKGTKKEPRKGASFSGLKDEKF